MFWERFFSFLKGYVEFCATGGFPERFINLCSGNSIDIKNVKIFKETIVGICGIKDYRKIRKIAKKSGMKVRIIRKHGLPFFIHKNRNRVGIIFGLVFMIIMTAFLSDRIWVISVSGNENIPSEKILSSFYDLGVKTGIKRDSLNAKQMAQTALTKVDGIMWNAVNIDGCKITLEIKEQVQKDIVAEDDTKPSNIVASNSGQITVIENFVGTPVTQVGSAVEKGDIVVSGAVINKDESVSFYKAEANVIARTKNTVSSPLSAFQDMRVYKKVKIRFFVTFFSLAFPVNYIGKPKEDFDFSSGEDFLSSAGEKLPVGIKTERFAVFERKKVRLTPTAIKLICAEKYFNEIDDKFDEIEIESVSSQKKFDKNNASIISEFQCIENIAESKEMDLTIEENFDIAQ